MKNWYLVYWWKTPSNFNKHLKKVYFSSHTSSKYHPQVLESIPFCGHHSLYLEPWVVGPFLMSVSFHLCLSLVSRRPLLWVIIFSYWPLQTTEIQKGINSPANKNSCPQSRTHIYRNVLYGREMLHWLSIIQCPIRR